MINLTANLFLVIFIFCLFGLHEINAYSLQSVSALTSSSKLNLPRINRKLYSATLDTVDYPESVFTVTEKSAQTKEALKSQILQLGASLDRGQVYK
jgi:hypothetical protein